MLSAFHPRRIRVRQTTCGSMPVGLVLTPLGKTDNGSAIDGVETLAIVAAIAGFSLAPVCNAASHTAW